MKKEALSITKSKKKRGIQIMIFVVGLLVLAVLGYFAFFKPANCSNMACFNEYQKECGKAEFVNDAEGAIWSYQIIGKSGDSCEFSVELVKLKRGLAEAGFLEGRSMNCLLPFGVVQQPEADLSYCSGFLKEGLQDIIIKRMHQYIYKNIGEIQEKFEEI